MTISCPGRTWRLLLVDHNDPQMPQSVPARGPFMSPTGIGEVVRVCLRQGAGPVFIPARESRRNGTIEHFNDTFDGRFFCR